MIQRYNNVDSTLLQNSIIRLISNIESTSLQNLFFAAISNQRYNNVDSTLLQNLTIITFFDLIQCGRQGREDRGERGLRKIIWKPFTNIICLIWYHKCNYCWKYLITCLYVRFMLRNKLEMTLGLKNLHFKEFNHISTTMIVLAQWSIILSLSFRWAAAPEFLTSIMNPATINHVATKVP